MTELISEQMRLVKDESRQSKGTFLAKLIISHQLNDFVNLSMFIILFVELH